MFGFGNPYAGAPSGGLWGRPQESAIPPDAARWQPVGMQWPRPPMDRPTQPSIPGMPPMGQGFPGGGFPGSPLGGLWGPRPPWGGPPSVGGLWGMPGGGPPMGPVQTPMHGYQGAQLGRMFGSNLYDTLVNSGVGPTQPLGGMGRGPVSSGPFPVGGGGIGGGRPDTGFPSGPWGAGSGVGGSNFDMPGGGGVTSGASPGNAGYWTPERMTGAQPRGMGMIR